MKCSSLISSPSDEHEKDCVGYYTVVCSELHTGHDIETREKKRNHGMLLAL